MARFREKIVNAIILKKQALAEADELITVYAQESGKLRIVAKSAKLTKSKLQSQLQPVFLSRLALVGNGPLPKVIQATALDTHKEIYCSLEKMHVWYVASELVMRATPDEAQNEQLYQLLVEFLSALRDTNETQTQLLMLLGFKIRLLQTIGVSIQPPAAGQGMYYFSNEHGGFLGSVKTADAVMVTNSTAALFHRLELESFNRFQHIQADSQELNTLITRYISYQLEREIRSDKFVSLLYT